MQENFENSSLSTREEKKKAPEYSAITGVTREGLRGIIKD